MAVRFEIKSESDSPIDLAVALAKMAAHLNITVSTYHKGHLMIADPTSNGYDVERRWLRRVHEGNEG